MRGAIVLGLALGLCAPAFTRADPVQLESADVQAFVQDNGGMDVIYALTFVDNEGRSQIRKAGPFYEPIHFTRAFLIDGDQRHPAQTRDAGGGYYAIEFGDHPTRAGGTYTIELHYRNNHRFADPTERDGKRLLAVWFNPIRWTMPIERSVVKLVLPLALDRSAVTKPRPPWSIAWASSPIPPTWGTSPTGPSSTPTTTRSGGSRSMPRSAGSRPRPFTS
jgi:hypothetical protein